MGPQDCGSIELWDHRHVPLFPELLQIFSMQDGQSVCRSSSLMLQHKATEWFLPLNVCVYAARNDHMAPSSGKWNIIIHCSWRKCDSRSRRFALHYLLFNRFSAQCIELPFKRPRSFLLYVNAAADCEPDISIKRVNACDKTF